MFACAFITFRNADVI